MGWESALTTVASLAGSFIQSGQQSKAARQQADAVIAEGNIATKNKAREVATRAGTQRVSFLNSGLTLEGTPTNVIDQTFTTGLEDINQLSSNANTKAKNIISEGRSKALSGLASSFSGFALPGGASDSLNESAAFGLNKAGFGNTAYSLLDGT